ncbi:MAG TPA: DUF302 domain-containing protein [Steroidobacteraceae bacterium]|jgi:uncharacterized protein (DUF302 family)|nr:DUF302 domain-containing protein [Steroidobacteraceae bacterium]
MNPEGLDLYPSQQGPAATMERVIAAVTRRGMAVMARIDHAAAAKKVGLDLRPTELLIFGNPKGGTPLMQAAQTLGIDLPLKALVFEDSAGKTWLAINAPKWLAARHGGAAGAEKAVGAMTAVLADIAKEVTGP